MSRFTDRVPDLTQVVAGACAIALGAVVVGGWYAESAMLVRFQPDFAPMPYVTAIAIAMAGVGLLLATTARDKAAGVVGLLVAAIGLLSLAQHVLDPGVHVDHIFGPLTASVFGAHTGKRMAPNAAVCLILVGTALLLRRAVCPARTAMGTVLLGYTVAAIGLVTLTGSAAGVPLTDFWGRLTSQAVHTATGFVVLGCGLAGRGWRDSETVERDAWRRPALVGVTSLIATLLVWQTLVTNYREQARSLALLQARHLRSLIVQSADVQVRTLEQMALRWTVQLPTHEQWLAVATGYLRAAAGSQTIEVVDAASRLAWVAPLDHVAPTGAAVEVRARAIETARRSRSTALTPLVDIGGHQGFFVVVPVVRDGSFYGAILGLFRLTEYLEQAQRQEGGLDYHVAIFDGSRRVYGPVESWGTSAQWGAEVGLPVRDATWRLRVWPTAARAIDIDGPLPAVLLGSGLILSGLAMSITFMAGTSRRRERELRQTTQKLQEQDRERDAAQVALRASEERYRSLVDHVSDIIYRADSTGRFTFVSPGVSRVMKREPAGLLGCHFLDLVEPSARAEVARFYSDQMGNRTPETYLEFPAIDGEGRTIWIGQSVQRLPDETGSCGFQAVARDITERKKADAEINAARDEALRSTRLKSQFVANISHELRTPMNGILGLTELLLETELTPEQRDHASTVRACGENLLALLNDILDLSKIEAGRLEIHSEPFDIRVLVQQTADLFEERARGKGVDLVYLVHHDVPEKVKGDPGRLRQVLTNLLGNAVKFTERGEITLRVHVEDRLVGGMMLRVVVTDTGIGVSPETQAQLFQPFVQADGSITRKYGGTGLGLVISRQLAELMGGRMGMSSQPGEGSSFWFTVCTTPVVTSPSTSRSPDETLHGLRVLVLNEAEEGRRRMRELLESWSMIVAEEGSSEGALATLQTTASRGEHFDVVLVELRKVAASTFEFAAAAQRMGFVPRTRLILLLGTGQPGDAERARQLGASAYLTKPIGQSQLFDCLATVMHSVAADAPDAVEPASLVTRHSLEDHRESAREPLLVVEDNPVNQKVLVGFLRRQGYRADVADNGLQALEALERRTYALVFMDSQMPEMDGFAATAEIRRREGVTRHTPIAAVTAQAMQGDRERCLAAGMDDYLSKPYNLAELSALLQRWVSVRTADGDGKVSTDTPASVADPLAADMDEQVLVVLRELETDEPGLLADVFTTFLRDTPPRIAMIAAAQEAGNAAAAERSAHGLKGSAGAVGARRMAALCQEIEQSSRAGQLETCTTPIAALRDEFARVHVFLGGQTLTAA